MSGSIHLISVSYGVESEEVPPPPPPMTITAEALSLEPPVRPQVKQLKNWYTPTPVPSLNDLSSERIVSVKSSSTSSVSSVVTTSESKEQMALMQILVFHKDDANEMSKRMMHVEVSSTLSLEDAVKTVLSNYGTLKRENRTSGRLYASKDDSFKKLEEINWIKHRSTQVVAYHPDYYFVFDTCGSIYTDLPASTEQYPLWHI